MKPAVAKTKTDISLDSDAVVPAGTLVLLLGHAEGQVLCFGEDAGLFRLPAAEVPARLRVLDLDATPEPATERNALSLVVALLVAGGSALHAAELSGGDSIHSLGDALWYAINTISTVGAGDVTPTTDMGRLIAAAMMVLGNPLYAKAGDDLSRRLLGPDGRASTDDLAQTLRSLAAALD